MRKVIKQTKALKEAQKKARERYVEMIKSHVLDFLKSHPVGYRLTELWEQRRISPLTYMTSLELTEFLHKNGCTITKTVDYIISKRR